MGVTLAELKMKGWMALVKELGYYGATKFILLYETGEGDYTKERKELLRDITIEEIIKVSQVDKSSLLLQQEALKNIWGSSEEDLYEL